MTLSKAHGWTYAKFMGRWTWILLVAVVTVVLNVVVFVVEVLIALADDDREDVDPPDRHNLRSSDLFRAPYDRDRY